MISLKQKIFISGLILLSCSCRKDAGNPDWDVDVLGPIAKSTITMNQVAGNFLLTQDSTQALTLVYNNEIFDLSGKNLFTVPDTFSTTTYALPIGPLTLVPGQELPIDTVTETKYQLGDVELNTIIVNTGKVKIEISSQIKERTTFTYRIPKATKNGASFYVSVEVPAATVNGDGVFSKVYDLDGYNFDLRGKNGTKVNTVYSTLKATVSADAQPVVVNQGDEISITTSFESIVPYYARGYFGSASVDVPPSTTEIDIFQNIISGALSLEKIKVKFTLENNLGIDASGMITNLNMQSSRTADSISLNHSIVGKQNHINRAVDNPLVPYIYSEMLDNNNSNIKRMVELLPDKIGYAMNVSVNPLGNVSGGGDFMYYDKGLKAILDIELPLSFALDKLTFADSVSIKINDQNNFHKIIGGNLVLNVHNGFPFSGIIKLILLDENQNAIDSLFSSNVFDAGVVDAGGKVTSVTKSKILYPLNESSINHLIAARRIGFTVQLSTIPANMNLKIYSDYKMDLKLVGDFRYSIK